LGLRGRHADVDDCDVGAGLPHELGERVGIAGCADDIEAFTFEKARDPFPQENVVLGDHDAGPGHS